MQKKKKQIQRFYLGISSNHISFGRSFRFKRAKNRSGFAQAAFPRVSFHSEYRRQRFAFTTWRGWN